MRFECAYGKRIGGPAADHLSEMRFQIEKLFGR